MSNRTGELDDTVREITVMSWLRAWAEKRALSTANEASYHQDKQSELERSIHKPLRA